MIGDTNEFRSLGRFLEDAVQTFLQSGDELIALFDINVEMSVVGVESVYDDVVQTNELGKFFFVSQRSTQQLQT